MKPVSEKVKSKDRPARRTRDFKRLNRLNAGRRLRRGQLRCGSGSSNAESLKFDSVPGRYGFKSTESSSGNYESFPTD
jgi:hypothetical protein